MSAQPQPELRFRAMSETDLPEVMAIEEDVYPFPWSIQVFRDCLLAGYECWVVQRGRDLIGYAVLSLGAGEAHLLNLCVAREEQGRGLGRRLLRRVFDLVRWHRAARLFLEVRPSNPAALALYESEGFRRIGRRPGYYPDFGGREDAIVMVRDFRAD